MKCRYTKCTLNPVYLYFKPTPLATLDGSTQTMKNLLEQYCKCKFLKYGITSALKLKIQALNLYLAKKTTLN